MANASRDKLLRNDQSDETCNLQESVSKGSEEGTQQSEQPSRRALFGLGAGAVISSLAACGETRFSTSKKNKIGAAPEAPPTGGDNLEKASSPSGSAKDGGVTPVDEAVVNSDAKPAPVDIFGKIDVSNVTLGDPGKIRFKLLGSKNSCLIAFGFNDATSGLKEGDDLYLLKSIGGKNALALGMRTIWSGQTGVVPHIFDNINLDGIDEVQILVVSGGKRVLYKNSSKATDFETTFGSGAKPIIDTAMHLAASHPGYDSLMPVFNFSGPTTPLGAGLVQVGATPRPYSIAHTGSTWTSAKFEIGTIKSGGIILATTNGLAITVTDILGRNEITVQGSSLAISSDFLLKTNTIVAYVFDPAHDHYHRYIYYVG